MGGPEVRLIPLLGLPEVREGDDVAAQIIAAAKAGPGVEPGDVFVVTQKIVSKAEGRVVSLDDVKPSAEAERLAVATENDPPPGELLLRGSAGIMRQRGPGLTPGPDSC